MAAMTANREFRVTVRLVREYRATITLRATSQAAADRLALLEYNRWTSTEGVQAFELGFPAPWHEYESIDFDPEIDTTFRCVDCGKGYLGRRILHGCRRVMGRCRSSGWSACCVLPTSSGASAAY
jgi:hypothetical protein